MANKAKSWFSAQTKETRSEIASSVGLADEYLRNVCLGYVSLSPQKALDLYDASNKKIDPFAVSPALKDIRERLTSNGLIDGQGRQSPQDNEASA